MLHFLFCMAQIQYDGRIVGESDGISTRKIWCRLLNGRGLCRQRHQVTVQPVHIEPDSDSAQAMVLNDSDSMVSRSLFVVAQ
jgi:hypothetical protein